MYRKLLFYTFVNLCEKVHAIYKLKVTRVGTKKNIVDALIRRDLEYWVFK